MDDDIADVLELEGLTAETNALRDPLLTYLPNTPPTPPKPPPLEANTNARMMMKRDDLLQQ